MIEVGWQDGKFGPLGGVRWVAADELNQARVIQGTPHTDNWFQTFTGRRVDLMNFKPEDVCIVDIFHSLPGITRFGAHSRRLNGRCYSVGEHSCLIAWYTQHMLRRPKRDILLALLHDAPEAYTGDIKRPVKNAAPILREIIKGVENTTFDVLGLPRAKPDWLRELDERIIVDEKGALMGHPADGSQWSHEKVGLVGLGVPIRCMAPDAVEQWMYDIYQEVRDA